jgi:hypothetical protein
MIPLFLGGPLADGGRVFMITGFGVHDGTV